MERGARTGVADINGNELLMGDSIRVCGCTHEICEVSYSYSDRKFIVLIGNGLAQWFLNKDIVSSHSILKLNCGSQKISISDSRA